MKELLTRTIGAKISAREYAEIEARAAAEGKTASSWVRSTLTARLESSVASREICIVIGELLALKTIVATLHFEASSRGPLTAATIHEVLALANKDKVQRAAELLTSSHRGI